jgi:hypothetical protein
LEGSETGDLLRLPVEQRCKCARITHEEVNVHVSTFTNLIRHCHLCKHGHELTHTVIAADYAAHLVFMMQVLEKALLLSWTDIYPVGRGANDEQQCDEGAGQNVAHSRYLRVMFLKQRGYDERTTATTMKGRTKVASRRDTSSIKAHEGPSVYRQDRNLYKTSRW